ncbi:MAG: chromate transporter [Candidatus Accumulibacter sp.]|nr:chromate transporter [Accumulibacter sp.]MBA4093367.1 chromate transporter [Accumulibacter sp.]
MSGTATLALHWTDWLQFFAHYLSLSLLSVGGAISTAPEMHRYLVDRQHWLNEAQFTASIAIAQAAPGPNVLFVALLGWNVGINAGGTVSGLFAAALAMFGMLLPSTTLSYFATRWGHRNRQLRAVRAFKLGLAPIVIALMLATGWLMASAHGNPREDWRLWLLTALSTLIVWRLRIHLLWLLAAGAALGAFGLL